MESDKRKSLEIVFDIINEYLESEYVSETIPYVPPLEMENLFDFELGEGSNNLDSTLSDVRELLKYTPRTGSKVFFNQLFAGKDIVSLAGEMITTALNNSMYTYKVAGAQIFVENAVINKMLELAGFEGGEGTFVPGGSLSNMTATLAAINKINPEHRNSGSGGKRYIAYTSEECHYSLKKNMGILGLGRDNMRYIEADDHGRMKADVLCREINEDLESGNIPFMVIATSGTTVRGAFDNIADIGEVAKSFDLWLHVDGAFGGSLLLNEKYSEYFTGLELADSMTWDPHKMMGAPLITSVVLFRESGTLKSIYSEEADYLFQTEADEYNPGNQSLQCGRRNDALKLWTAWKYYGDEGFSVRVDKQISLAQYASKVVNQSECFDLIFQPDSINVCFNYEGVDPSEICNELDRQGLAKVGYGSSGGKTFIRLVTANPDLNTDDIDRLINNITMIGQEIMENSECYNG